MGRPKLVERISPIPTEYAGCDFRSRLEARWACWFDVLGWHWEYEPLDLDAYLPDFLLLGPYGKILVEVRPFTRLSEFRNRKLLDHAISAPGDISGVLLLGATIFEASPNARLPYIGWFAFARAQSAFAEANLLLHRGTGVLLHDAYAYQPLMGIGGEGDRAARSEPFRSLRESWNRAGARVQWQG